MKLWEERNKLWEMIHNGPITELRYLPPPPSVKRKYPDSRIEVSSCLKRSEIKDIEMVDAKCNCNRCRVEIAIQKERLLWKPRENV